MGYIFFYYGELLGWIFVALFRRGPPSGPMTNNIQVGMQFMVGIYFGIIEVYSSFEGTKKKVQNFFVSS